MIWSRRIIKLNNCEIFLSLVENPFSDDDVLKGIKVLKSKQLTLSKETHRFENFFLKIKIKLFSYGNSGSSANLLALQC